MKEIWKPVRGKEKYAEISNYGQIHRFERVIYSGRNHKSKRIQEETLTYGTETPDGYLYATIGCVSKGVHVWVYLTFVGDIPKGYEVNHLDENPKNNRLNNLNLLTSKENKNWGTHNERVAAAQKNDPKKSTAVQALDKDGNVVMEFPSTAEAQRQGFNKCSVSQCCNGKLKTYKGYIWRYTS